MHALVCPKCGAKLVADDPLCNQCGAPVWSSDAPTGKKSGKRRIVYWMAGCAGAVVLGLVALRLILIAVASKVVSQSQAVSQRSAQDLAHAELYEIVMALDRYAESHDATYPADLLALSQSDAQGKPYYDVTALRDPWDRPYVYELSNSGSRARLSTLGRNGKKGGSDEDRDIERVLTAHER